MTDVTGGRCYFPDDVDELDEIYDKIADELTARYSLGYVSGNDRTDGRRRQLDVKISPSRSDLGRVEVRSREGYFAPYLADKP